MKKLYFLPYKMGSMSVRLLQDQLGGLKIKPHGNYRPYPTHLVVNWGRGHAPYWSALSNGETILNHWDKVLNAVNKLRAFKLLQENSVPVPEYTSDPAVAREWARKDVVFCRQVLDGMEGAGIVVCSQPDAIVDAPLYTKLFPKDTEYRVHIFKGKVIDTVQKKLKSGWRDIPNRSKYVRNTANGWIFARQGVVCPESGSAAAIGAMAALGLDFGAVDLAVSKAGKVAVFEVNTAPGIEGTTVSRYVEAIRAELQ